MKGSTGGVHDNSQSLVGWDDIYIVPTAQKVEFLESLGYPSGEKAVRIERTPSDLVIESRPGGRLFTFAHGC